ncbi:cysteine synthase CysM [Candidatus Magnetaquicoccus inordinatus]|uniref:cysteine synthase CysM n=1 Tax=Candidatus Magnetaquicoccus inordinatus TaxID=2496818 RepID=UPI00102B3B9D|nr:cysteine synthase CysM [Candidatus Magnetaquicoccus inordinatus]
MATLEECIGNTPMVELSRIAAGCSGVRLLAKLEGNNPAGSVKDRAAYSMFMGAMASGRLREGVRIIEPTSGNTGIALAMMAARLRIPITLVMPESMSLERRAVMAAYGADLELTADEAGMEGTIDRAWEMVRAGEGIIFDQFSNDDNWKAHYRGTGPEIWRDTEGKVSHFVSSMGTTGTIMGVSRYLKERNPGVQIIGVHPEEGSKIPGIRRWPQEYLPKIFDASRVDRIMDVSAEAAREMTLRLAREEGIFSGHSAGGATAAALTVAQELAADGGCVVVILPDRGDRYVSTDLFT